MLATVAYSTKMAISEIESMSLFEIKIIRDTIAKHKSEMGENLLSEILPITD